MLSASSTFRTYAGAICLGLALVGASGSTALAQASWYDRLSKSVDRFVDRLQTPERNRTQKRRQTVTSSKKRPSVTGPINAPPPEAKPGRDAQRIARPIPLEPLHRRLQALETGDRLAGPRNLTPQTPQVILTPRVPQEPGQERQTAGRALIASEAFTREVVSEPLAPLSLFTEPVDLSQRNSLSTEFIPSAHGGDEIGRLLAAQEAQEAQGRENAPDRARGLQGTNLPRSDHQLAGIKTAPRETILTPRGPRPPPGRTSLMRTASAATRQAPFAAPVPPMVSGGTIFERPGIWAPAPLAKPAVPPGWKAPEVRVASLPAPTRGVCGGDSARWATYTAKAAISQGACGDPRPVLLASVGKVGVKVAPGATVNCRMTAALVRWADKVVAPAARRHLGANVVSVRNMASYACRRRNNAKSGRLSEHGYANALDIGEFRLSNGGTVSVLDHWRSGGGRQAFLREVHKKSCGIFKTVLGPNADRHHQNHFHLDLARRKSTYCR